MTVFELLTHPFWSKHITRSKIYKVKIKEHVWAQKQNNHLQGSKIEKTEVTGLKLWACSPPDLGTENGA